MAKGFKHGTGGAPLNFKVVGGTDQPANPSENTIWVNTDQKINGWYFGADEPNVYDTEILYNSDGRWLSVPCKLSHGDICNFVIPRTVSTTYEDINIVDQTGRIFAVRQFGGIAGTGWHAGTMVGFTISDDVFPIGDNPGYYGTAFISSWGFSFHEEGTVWITTGTSSPVGFNALKKNSIQVHPLLAKQYVGGAWVSKTAKIYQDGGWAEWWDGTLYYQGNRYVAFTGGWEVSKLGYDNVIDVTFDSTSITLSGSYMKGGILQTQKAIDVTGFNTLTINVTDFGDKLDLDISFGLASTYGTNDYAAFANLSGTGEISVDIQQLTGAYYPSVALIGKATHDYKVTFDSFKLS